VTDQLVVVVVAYNSASIIEGLLDSLPAALPGVDYGVIVVDNASVDDTCDVVARRADCRLLQAENLGYAAGINRGVSERPGASAYLVLNPDVRLAPGFARPALETLELPGTGIVAPRVIRADGSLDLSLRREPTLLRALGLTKLGHPLFAEHVTDPSDYDEPQVVDWALGAVLLVSGQCHRALGGWDESFFLYSEETDFCLRARDAGYLTRYDPRPQALHIGGQSGQDDRTHSLQIVNRVELFRRRHSAPAVLAYWFLGILSELSWLARGHSQSKASVKALLRMCRPAGWFRG
jgi:GT2 family glycosyltransferase